VVVQAPSAVARAQAGVAEVTGAILVGVGLIGVGQRAVVAAVADTIRVGVRLFRVREVPAVVRQVTGPIRVPVVISGTDATVADIADAIAIGVRLVRVRAIGAVVMGHLQLTSR
jgi:hypothetical protein